MQTLHSFAHRVLQEFVSECDIVTVNTPLYEATHGLINDKLLSNFKKGAWLVNTARGAICDKDAITRAIKNGQLNGQLNGYSGNVWNVQPVPSNHP